MRISALPCTLVVGMQGTSIKCSVLLRNIRVQGPSIYNAFHIKLETIHPLTCFLDNITIIIKSDDKRHSKPPVHKHPRLTYHPTQLRPRPSGNLQHPSSSWKESSGTFPAVPRRLDYPLAVSADSSLTASLTSPPTQLAMAKVTHPGWKTHIGTLNTLLESGHDGLATVSSLRQWMANLPTRVPQVARKV